MKKLVALTLALCLSTTMLAGCGCMDSSKDVPTLPTNGETVTPTTKPTTAPTTATTAPTTVPTTAATEVPSDTTGTPEGPMDDILGGSMDDVTNPTGEGRNRGRMIPRG